MRIIKNARVIFGLLILHLGDAIAEDKPIESYFHSPIVKDAQGIALIETPEAAKQIDLQGTGVMNYITSIPVDTGKLENLVSGLYNRQDLDADAISKIVERIQSYFKDRYSPFTYVAA